MRKINQEFLDAVRNEDVSKVESLLESGADINFKDFNDALFRLTYEKFTFHYQDKHKDIAKLLLRYGAEFDIEDFHVKKLLDHSFEYKDTEVIELFLKGGVDPNTRLNSINNETLLHNASIHIYTTHGENQIKAMELLLKYGADPNAKDNYGNTPLHYCSVMLDIKRVELLLKYGANPNAKNNGGNTPISNMLVVPHLFRGDYLKGDVLFVLLAYGAALNDDDRNKIKEKPNLKNYLIAFEQIKAMAHLGRVIETYKNRNKRENANIVAQYVNDEDSGQGLIKEFQAIKENYKELSFIPKYLFSTVEDMIEDYRKIKIGNKAAGDFVGVINSADDTKKTGYPGSSYIGSLLNQYLNDQDIKNLALVNKKNYEEERFNEPLNKLLTKLQEVCKGSSIVTEPKLEELSHNNQCTT